MMKFLMVLFVWAGDAPVDFEAFPGAFDTLAECQAQEAEFRKVVTPPDNAKFLVDCISVAVPDKP